jgi:hypothetical protein
MPLDSRQISELEQAIATYAFPAVYFDFGSNIEVRAKDMRVLETAIRQMLVSVNGNGIRDGLANVIYWGWAQNSGIRDVRVRRFRDGVTPEQIDRFRFLIASGAVPTLANIRAINMPQFSGVSFISKILAFLDPTRYCVLDRGLLKLSSVPGRALHQLSVPGTQIKVTPRNERAYDAWRVECAEISALYFGGRYRVVDVERGFFQLLQEGRTPLAQQVYAAA